MIGRRKFPDGKPFRLYERVGKFVTSYGYKLPDGTWAFRLSAPTTDIEAVEKIRREAYDRANVLNGNFPNTDTVAGLIERYFTWQDRLPETSENRKSSITLQENRREAVKLVKVFGKVRPKDVKPVHIYKYLALREEQGAPIKANKEIALLSAILEFGRRLGLLETNPCRGIKYNKSRPRDKYVISDEIDFMMGVAADRGGSYIRIALCLYIAYLTVSRPSEMRVLLRQSITDAGIQMPIAKRKKGHAQRYKLIEWSDELRQTIDHALALQRVTSMYVFGNNRGQPYSRSGFATILRRLMEHCEKAAKEKNISFNRFSLADMRPTAVTDRMEQGDENIENATGHVDRKMVNSTYDRRRIRRAKATR